MDRIDTTRALGTEAAATVSRLRTVFASGHTRSVA
jgi:aldehyde dehydrogenase (NAD+)